MKAFTEFQFNYCPINMNVLFKNSKIKRLHERALRIVFCKTSRKR